MLILGEHKNKTGSGALHEEQDVVIDGLVAPGYSERHAREALKRVPPDVKGASARIKETLRQPGK